ncbi:MAG: hypothetical protein CFE43_12015 [Burkholderiales bacterium PBB3]|nr:MAG: hypothetical protein CFE43_12015 [Burkholderiales bacterium PBB3]
MVARTILNIFMQNTPFPVENAIARCTVRILAGIDEASLNSVGTGFFYKVVHPITNLSKTLVVTNKHVISNAKVVRIVISSAEDLSDVNQYGQPVGRQDDVINWSLAGHLFEHPDAEIDLCGIDVTLPLGNILHSGRQLRAMFLDSTWLPESQDLALVRDIEQVLVVGYPNGMWDQHNNMPVARQGVTATHPLAPYQGKSNFLIDVAAFGGSSGSPVFTYETPLFRLAHGGLTPGTRVQFIGVVWGVVEQALSGELKQVEIPAVQTTVAIVKASLNLAIALHSRAVLALDELVFPGITAGRG